MAAISIPLDTSAVLGGREEVRRQVREVFSTAEEETSEPGKESAFSRAIVGLVQHDSAAALDAIEERVRDPNVNTELAAEALRWLGHMDHVPSRDQRMRFLSACLESP